MSRMTIGQDVEEANKRMKVAYLIAGAGGMYCGSCMRDNRVVAKLKSFGHDIVLLPLYTPIRTDESDVSEGHVHYGGINVFLQQKSAFFRHTPWFIDRLFDTRRLLRGVGRLAAKTRAEDVGALTVSILEGNHGAQRKELDKLIAHLKEMSPTLVHLPNLMFIGIAGEIKKALGVPVVCSLAGEDVFMDALPEEHRHRCFSLVRENAGMVDGYISPTNYYAQHAATHFNLPTERIHTAVMGIAVDDFPQTQPDDTPFIIGYLARICPEKGLANLTEAFSIVCQTRPNCRLRIAGYLGGADQPYWKKIDTCLRNKGLSDRVDLLGEVDRAGKLSMLRSLHVLSTPTTYAEAKGLYILEALACGVPVVQPRHGAFPEIIEATGGGILYEPGDTEALAAELIELHDEPVKRKAIGDAGRIAVAKLFNDDLMATQTWSIYEEIVKRAYGA